MLILVNITKLILLKFSVNVLFIFQAFSLLLIKMDGKKRLSGAAYRKKAKAKNEKLTIMLEKSGKISNYFKLTDSSGDNFYYCVL